MTWRKAIIAVILKIRELIHLDKRSLALFRILIAITTLFDLADRARDISAHYSDDGILSRALVLDKFWNGWWTSIYMISGQWYVIAIIMVINAIVATLLMVGYRTKWMTFLTWFFVTSIQDRNYLVGHGGDVLHRVILFFSLFLPLGDVYSIDAALKKPETKAQKTRSPPSYMIASIATSAFIIQVLIMYLSAHHLKTGREWNETYTATWLALQLDFFRRPIADVFLLFPTVLQFLTWAVRQWQLVGVLFFFSPIFSGPSRMFSVFGYFCMHVGFFAFLRLGQFGYVTTGTILGLIPTWFWNTFLFKRLHTPARKEFKLLYPSSCTRCYYTASIIKEFFLIKETQIVPADSDVEEPCQCGNHCNWRFEDDFVLDVKPSKTIHPSWLLVQEHDGKVHKNWNALTSICQASPLLWPMTKLLNLSFLKPFARGIDLSMQIIHSHIPLVKKSDDEVVHETTTKPKEHPMWRIYNYFSAEFREDVRQTYKITKVILLNFVAGFFMYLMLSWNAGNLGFHQYSTPNELRTFIWITHLDQSWSMFAPRPPDSWWYYNIDATLDDGRNVELFNNGGIFTWEPSEQTWQRPDVFYVAFKNHRWFKYFENGLNSHAENSLLRLNFGRWICREYNKRHSGKDKLWKFSLYFVRRRQRYGLS